MALAFADYLALQLDSGLLSWPQMAAVLALESGMARSRRSHRELGRRGTDWRQRMLGARTVQSAMSEPSGAGPRFFAAPGVQALRLPGGTLELVQHIERYLFEVGLVPALTLCDDAPRPDPIPAVDEAQPIYVLLEPQSGARVELSNLDADYAAVLGAVKKTASPLELALRTKAAGLSAERSLTIAEALAEAGVIERQA